MRRLAILTVAACLLGPALAAAQAVPGRVLVVPFENVEKDLRVQWLGEASAVLLADALNARGMGAITRVERVRAFEELHLPLSASLSRATVIRVGQMVGAGEVILGQFRLQGDQLSVTVQAITLDVGRLQPDVTERAPLTELFDIFERLAQRITGGAPAGGPGTADARPPLEAFENYIKGLVAESPAAQAAFLESALKQFRGYDRARLALWEVRTEQGDHAAALEAVEGIPESSRFSARGRFAAASSLLEMSRFDEAFEALNHLAKEQPTGSVFNNLGVVQLRRGGSPQSGLPTYFFTRAADADPGDPDFLFNLGYAYALQQDPKAAIYWLREALRRDPADAEAHFALAQALEAAGSTTEAARERELARRLSATIGELEQRGAGRKPAIPDGLERVRLDLDLPRSMRPEQAIVNTAQREQQDLARFHLEQGQRHFDREEDREAMTELRRAVYLSPYEARAHRLIGQIHLRGGRPQDAVDAFKIAIWSQDSVAARVALAEAYIKLGRADEARPELERALALDPDSAEARKLLEQIGKS
jgi:predicted Zn-dependent protease